jgi:hypothetical protein
VSTVTAPDPGTDPGTDAAVGAGTTDAPMTVRLVDRVGRVLAGKGLSRRRFLSRVAVVGAAVAVDPIRYAVKPGSAYAQVCGDGASCGSGWTAFCCTVNSGRNTCPPGSYVAGWWRIDDSPFCLGAARYVIDCNRSPNASCSCRCADGACDKRRVCCNNFRYGQCNTQVRGVTEVVCRVVTCTAPWVWDSACGRTVRVDNRTRSHNATCLPGRNTTPIEIRYQDLGLRGSILGDPTGAESSGPAGGRYRRYQNGTIAWRSATGALAVHGAIDRTHIGTGGLSGPLGYPTTEVRAVGDGSGLHVRYQSGTVYQRTSSASPVAVFDPLDSTYRGTHGGPRGSFGYPTSTTRRADSSTLTRFQNAVLVAVSGRPVVRVALDVLATAEAPAPSSPDAVGWPIAAETTSGTARLQRFEGGIVTGLQSGQLVAVGAYLADRYLAAGGPGSDLGRPTSAPLNVASGRGRMLPLAAGGVYWKRDAGTYLLAGATWRAYQDAGGPNGRLGLPTSERVSLPNGQVRASFEFGAIVLEPDGSTSVVEVRRGRAPTALQRTSPTGTGGRTGRRPTELTP